VPAHGSDTVPACADAFESDLVRAIARFLRDTRIAVRSSKIDRPTLLPGLYIQGGELAADETELAYPGDLLHEAGPITLTDPRQRPAVVG
jgi:hypothetical protein